MTNWTGRSGGYSTRTAAGDVWELRLDTPRVGLYRGEAGPILGLAGLARPGVWEPGALCAKDLVFREILHGELHARFRPEGWHELEVLTLWRQAGPEAFDLEVEVHTRSVGDLHRLEVELICAADPDLAWDAPRVEIARDEHHGHLGRDGREPEAGLSRGGFATGSLAPEWTHEQNGTTLATAVHPEDASRILHYGDGRGARFALFGYDLERGVVLRGRCRAWHVRREADGPIDWPARVAAFRVAPPPLRTW